MTLNFLDLYNECASQPWSMYDAEAESMDDLEGALKISINKALSYLWNLCDWSFRYVDMTINLTTGRANYAMPDGLIAKTTIRNKEKHCVKYGKTFLDYIDDYEIRDEKVGAPEYFFKKGENIYIYPTPDKAYKLNLTYMLAPYGLDNEGAYIYELKEEDDYINIPEKYEAMFKNCLISLAMMYAIAEETDENYSSYKRQYNDALMVLMDYCKDDVVDKRVII